ncbi:hypothetical protein [Ruminococcus albus]|uniref:hypothetical protein n=1 Tax=Ruminococcus albus TaxID=1264 RepID=UPI000466CCF0|nr:hypothetical protein [Ruminococcus albus]
MAFEVSKYQDINKTIDEYYADVKTIKFERKIIEYYPRTLILLVASKYESSIKDKINAFLYHPKSLWQSLANNVKNKGDIDKLPEIAFKKFYTNPSLDASQFYNFWGGITFRDKVKTRFEFLNNEIISQIEEILRKLEDISSLKNIDKEFEKYDAINDCLKINFDDAEQSFLEIKKQRNCVAHNFLSTEFSSTFEIVVELYYKSMSYAMALEDIFIDMTEE